MSVRLPPYRAAAGSTLDEKGISALVTRYVRGGNSSSGTDEVSTCRTHRGVDDGSGNTEGVSTGVTLSKTQADGYKDAVITVGGLNGGGTAVDRRGKKRRNDTNGVVSKTTRNGSAKRCTGLGQ